MLLCWWWTALARLFRFPPRQQSRQPVPASFTLVVDDSIGPQMWARGYTAEDV